jgi:hypothetical protein
MKKSKTLSLTTVILLSLLVHTLLLLFLAQIKYHSNVLFQESNTLTAPIIFESPTPELSLAKQLHNEELSFIIKLKENSVFGSSDHVAPEGAGKQDVPEANSPVAPTASARVKQPTSSMISAAENSTQQPVQALSSLVEHKTEKQGSPLTLAAFTQGFLNYTKVSSSDEVDINSYNPHYLEICQKIGWALQHSFHLHNHPLTLETPLQTNVTLHLVIERTGKLRDCYFSHSIIKPVESFLKNIVRNAVLPPLPDSLKKDSLKLKIAMNINAQQGTHSYYFTFRG